jgi:hypothetical protein
VLPNRLKFGRLSRHASVAGTSALEQAIQTPANTVSRSRGAMKRAPLGPPEVAGRVFDKEVGPGGTSLLGMEPLARIVSLRASRTSGRDLKHLQQCAFNVLAAAEANRVRSALRSAPAVADAYVAPRSVRKDPLVARDERSP